MRFEILGPIRVRAAGGEVTVTGRHRAMLAVLLLHANQVVGIDRLVDAIWGDSQPRDARNQVHVCVSRLRRQLLAAGFPRDTIVTDPVGYRIAVDPACVDLLEFRRLAAEARTAIEEGDRQVAVDRARSALRLWRGPALAGADSALLRAAAAALEEERARATEQRIELELALGGAGELISEVTELVVQHPYREGLHAALMLALYRTGRQAEALATYRRIHGVLVDEVGTEPGVALRQLHQRILAEDPTLLVPASPARADGSARHSLPRAIGDFTGRPEAVARLVDAAENGFGAPTVLAIDGMAGIGKTTLATQVAHLMVSRYPDAQLFIDLHGHSERRPVEPVAALDALLRQVGVPAGRIPPEVEERAALWRSELADRRAIVVWTTLPALHRSGRCCQRAGAVSWS